jgi:hypothetical protein
MYGRILVTLVALLPFGTHAAIGCQGHAFGDTVRRYVDTGPPRAFNVGMPEGRAVPAHLVVASGGSWGCGTSWAIDLDTGHAWKRLRCISAENFDDLVASPSWQGAQFGSYTNFDGKPAREAIKEGQVPSATIARIICAGNDAWGADKWGGQPHFDAHGDIVVPTPPMLAPDMFATLLLKNSEVTRTFEYASMPEAESPLAHVEAVVIGAVNAAVGTPR